MNQREFPAFLSLAHGARPRTALVLGSGLNALVERMRICAAITFASVPMLGATSVRGHQGSIVLAEWASQPLLVFCGRLHRYEGHPWDRIQAPVKLAAELGVRTIILTNAAGGIRTDLGPGSIMAIDAYVDWTRPFPCSGGKCSIPLGDYSGKLLARLKESSRKLKIEMATGTYAGLLGPNYETPAEIRSLRAIGADAVGMSTIREIEAAVERGMKGIAISCITNHAAGLSDVPLSHDEVLANSKLATEHIGRLLERFLLPD